MYNHAPTGGDHGKSASGPARWQLGTHGTQRAGDDAIELAWFPLDRLPDDLAFASHRQALAELIERLAKA